jgi:hypothetical protein
MSQSSNGLPGAVRPEEAGDPARLDGEREIVDGQPGAVPLAEMACLDHDALQSGPEIVMSLMLPAGARDTGGGITRIPGTAPVLCRE